MPCRVLVPSLLALSALAPAVEQSALIRLAVPTMGLSHDRPLRPLSRLEAQFLETRAELSAIGQRVRSGAASPADQARITALQDGIDRLLDTMTPTALEEQQLHELDEDIHRTGISLAQVLPRPSTVDIDLTPDLLSPPDAPVPGDAAPDSAADVVPPSLVALPDQDPPAPAHLMVEPILEPEDVAALEPLPPSRPDLPAVQEPQTAPVVPAAPSQPIPNELPPELAGQPLVEVEPIADPMEEPVAIIIEPMGAAEPLAPAPALVLPIIEPMEDAVAEPAFVPLAEPTVEVLAPEPVMAAPAVDDAIDIVIEPEPSLMVPSEPMAGEPIISEPALVPPQPNQPEPEAIAVEPAPAEPSLPRPGAEVPRLSQPLPMLTEDALLPLDEEPTPEQPMVLDPAAGVRVEPAPVALPDQPAPILDSGLQTMPAPILEPIIAEPVQTAPTELVIEPTPTELAIEPTPAPVEAPAQPIIQVDELLPIDPMADAIVQPETPVPAVDSPILDVHAAPEREAPVIEVIELDAP